MFPFFSVHIFLSNLLLSLTDRDFVLFSEADHCWCPTTVRFHNPLQFYKLSLLPLAIHQALESSYIMKRLFDI